MHFEANMGSEMTRRSFLRVSGCTAAAAILPGVGKSAGTPRPNIILFLVDDQRNDTLGCAGHPVIKTPTIDGLASEGVLFRNAFVTTPICAASRASILTGLYERAHRFTFGARPINRDLCRASYPALLRNAGYRTGFIGKFGVEVPNGERAQMFHVFRSVRRNPYFQKVHGGQLRHATELVGDYAIAFLQKAESGGPFCLSVSFNAPHAEQGPDGEPYPWPKAMDGMYADVKIPPPRLSDPAIFRAQPDFLKKSLNRKRFFWRWDTPEKYERNMRAYFRMISGVDRVVGRIVAELKRRNLAGNTILIYTSDNGYYMGDRGFAGKWSHYEESLRVPLVLFDPRLPRGKRGKALEEIALNIDLPATILELAGVSIPAQYQGRSLVPLISGRERGGWRSDFLCEHLMNHKEIPKWEGVHGQRYVYARYFTQEPVFEFLHDLRVDPDELRNFATDPKYQETLDRLRRRCNELKDAHQRAP